jgi:hypothetical protein
MENPLPFEEEWISDKISIRRFASDTNSEELKWHFDEEDRVIETEENTDWQFQFDNKLPQPILGKILIKKGEWHRLIRGSSELSIKITRL